MLLFRDQGRDKADDIGAGIDHDQAVVHGIRDDGADGAVKDQALHEAHAAVLRDAVEIRQHFVEDLCQIGGCLRDMVDQVQGLVLVQDGIDGRAGKGIAAVGRAVVAGGQ